MTRTPHPIPYQGSKRTQAPQIATLIRAHGPVRKLYEPFCGSGAVTIHAVSKQLATRFVLGDTCGPLVDIWRSIVASPDELADQYAELWHGQKLNDPDYYSRVRAQFNDVEAQPHLLLYLIARCVKNAIRFNAKGRFTQSADKRRLGMRPEKMRQEIFGVHRLLNGKTECFAGDFEECLSDATPDDLVYMDPPYQGTSVGRDKRYFDQLSRERLVSVLSNLNERRIPWILSYDGSTGSKSYGEPLPCHLQAHRMSIHVGRSSQATLNGRQEETIESLYLSPYLQTVHDVPRYISISSQEPKQLVLAEAFS